MPTSESSRSAFRRMNQRTFAKKGVNNMARNAAALKQMSLAERETGMTADQLADQQREMREEFYARQVATA